MCFIFKQENSRRSETNSIIWLENYTIHRCKRNTIYFTMFHSFFIKWLESNSTIWLCDELTMIWSDTCSTKLKLVRCSFVSSSTSQRFIRLNIVNNFSIKHWVLIKIDQMRSSCQSIGFISFIFGIFLFFSCFLFCDFLFPGFFHFSHCPLISFELFFHNKHLFFRFFILNGNLLSWATSIF